MVYLFMSARLSEVLKPKLSWKDIDFENEIFTLPVRKGCKSTDFPLNELLLEIFRNLKRNPYWKEAHARFRDFNETAEDHLILEQILS